MAAPYRMFWLFVLGLHAVGAGAWWRLLPGGFPPPHRLFWSNGVAPVVVLAGVVAAVVAARARRWSLLRLSLVSIPSAWLGATIAARLLFPISLGRLIAVPILWTLLMAAAIALTFRKIPAPGRAFWVVVIVSTGFGALVPLSRRPQSPDTRPLNVPMPEFRAGTEKTGRSGSGFFVHPGDGSITVKAGRVGLHVRPLLRFLSRSPDGCLTLLAPRALREGPELRLIPGPEEAEDFRYRADYDATLRIRSDRGPITLEAMARLPRPIYSHLNTFCDLEISGHRRLSLMFSPCAGRRIEVLPADYPAGRPLRLAFADAGGGFHVVEAQTGEKGPFRELAGGKLARLEPLEITIYDEETAAAVVSLDDWSAQLGTSLSPTAGWGVPVNAIEFRLDGDSPGAPAAIYFTLAGTSVGRGWESVGHAAGTYRNRMTIEVLGDRPVVR